MPDGVASVYSEAEDFEAAIFDEGCLGLLVTRRGAFRARLTQVVLHRLRLSAVEEQLPRITFVTAPADMLLVSLPIGDRPAPIWGGVEMRPGEMMTLGAGQRLHTRTGGPCRWGSIWLPAAELARYGSALTGAAFTVSSSAHWWRLRPAISRRLRHLHSAAIGAVQTRSKVFIAGETAHGLEQQLIDAVVEGLSKGSASEPAAATRQHQALAARFEALLQTRPDGPLRMAEIFAALGVSARILHICCEEQLGMGPAEYVRIRRMHLVYRALRNGNPDIASISTIAQRYGFRGLGHFTANYRALFGELPSATLRQQRGNGMARLTLRTRRR